MESIKTLDEFVGKSALKRNLRIYLDSCIKRNETLEHCLFFGLPGTGKTTLAKIIAHELDHKLRIVQGSTIQKPIDVINLLITLGENDILFIDEIHSINIKCYELFYSAMEEGYFDLNIGSDYNTRVTRIKLPHFTLIGATTKLGQIPKPFEDRFGIIFHISEYSYEELTDIVKLYAGKLNLNLTDDEIDKIANASKGIPRVGYTLLRRVNDFRLSDPHIPIEEIMHSLGYIYQEFDTNDLKYLDCLENQDHPVGLRTIAQTLGMDEDTIQLKIEPYLLRKRLISKSSGGRSINKDGSLILKQMINAKTTSSVLMHSQ